MRRSFLVLALLASAAPSPAATITVTNTNASGAGSLAQAITTANTTAIADEIHFAIAADEAVTIAGTLPPITQPLLIDGYTQGDAQPNTAESGSNAIVRVQLDASEVLAGNALLNIEADNSTVRGISVAGIPEKRIGIKVPAGVSGATISGCFVGIAANGVADSSAGIGIRDEGADSVIGGDDDVGQRNIISGNDIVGIDERGNGTRIAGNLIGTSRSADIPMGNGKGILASAGASGVVIGGDTALAQNLIAGNSGNGIEVAVNAAGAVEILRNHFVGNGGLGIDLGGDGVTPNDTDDADSGPNSLQNYPVLTFVRTDDAGNVVVEGYLEGPAGSYLLLFYQLVDADPSGFGEGLEVVDFEEIAASEGTTFFRYKFPLPELADDSAAFVTATAENLSTQETSEFSNAAGIHSGGKEIVVTNTNDSGAGSLRAAISEANDSFQPNTIVFELPTPAQTIKTESELLVTEPLIIDGYTQADSSVNTLDFGSNAAIQVEVDGSLLAPGTAIFESTASDVLLRGLVLNRAHGNGLQYENGNHGAIEGCFVGTDRTGMIAENNGGHGIFTGPTASGFRLGGPLPSQRNIVSSNSGHGIRLIGENPIVQGNIVGADADGAGALPNLLSGISLEGEYASVGTNTPSSPAANVVAFNVEDGISVVASATRAEIVGNSIHSNGDLGIDLVSPAPGVTPNDEDDVDTGANDLQNFPILTSVRPSQTQLEVTGTLDVPLFGGDLRYSIALYANEACDASGNGEGQIFLGSREVSLLYYDEEFSFTIPAIVTTGLSVTATATDSFTGDTSEFSSCFLVEAEVPVCGDASGDDNVTAGDALTVLKTAVGSAQCEPCICDVNGSSAVNTSDALLVLKLAVGQPVLLNCSPCE